MAGIRVLDMGRYIAGPACALLLADQGAEVVRVERPAGAEDRRIVPLAGDDGGALYVNVNRGKRSLTLDPTQPAGRAVLERLLATVDVVVANLPGRALAALGVDAASVHGLDPSIVLVTLDAFGPGPWEDRLGFDGIGQAMSGMAHLTVPPDAPVRSAALWVDHMTATLAAQAVTAALFRRERTGEGAHVTGSLLASALHVMAPAYTEESTTAPRRVGSGNRAQTVGPADICATRDGWVVVQVVGDRMFRRFARMVGRPELVDDPRFATDMDRGEHRDELCDVAAAFCADRTTDEVLAAFEGAGLATAPVLTPTELVGHPHVVAGGMLEPVRYPGVADGAVGPAPPVALDGARAERGPAPTLGEHTDQVLAELGYARDVVTALRADGIV